MDIYNVDIKNINSEQTQKRAKMETKVKFDKLPTQMQKYIQESEKNKKQAESERIGKYNAAMQKLQQKRTSRLASEKLEADRVKNLRGDELTEYLRGSYSKQFGANTDKILGNLIDKAKGYITDNSKEYGWEEFNKAIDQHNEEVKKYEEEAYKLIPSRTQSQIQADIDAVKAKSNRPLLVKAGEAIASGWNYITGNQDKTEQMQNRNQHNEDLLESYEKELEKRKYWDSLDGTTEEKLNAMAEYDAYERFIAEAEKQGYTADELINYLGTRAGDSLLNWLDNVKTSAEKYASFGSGFVKSFTGAKNPTLKPYSPTQDEKSDKLLDKLWESAKYGMKQSDAVLEEAAKENKAGKRALDTYNQYINVAVDPVAQGVGDVVGATAYMLPTIALTSFIPGAADDVTLGAQAANTLIKQVPSAALMRELGYTDAYIEARNDGASISQAKDYASREGINQGLGDMLIGGLGGIGDGILSTSLNKITKGAFSKTLSKAAGKLVTSPAGRTALKYFGSSLGEGIEESIQNVVSTYNKKFTYDKNAKVNWGDVLYEGIIGSAMGGFFSLSEISSNYKAYKADADVVNTFAKAAEKIATTDDAEAMRDLGEFIVAQMDETINDKSVDDETKERAEFIKAGISSITEVVGEKSADIISTNESISDAVESIATSSTAEVVENTARLVDTVADNIEPSTDAVNATIDIVREKIADANSAIEAAQTESEKREAEIEKGVLEAIDSTLRNRKAEVEAARQKSEATQTADVLTATSETVYEDLGLDNVHTAEDAADAIVRSTRSVNEAVDEVHALRDEYLKLNTEQSKAKLEELKAIDAAIRNHNMDRKQKMANDLKKSLAKYGITDVIIEDADSTGFFNKETNGNGWHDSTDGSIHLSPYLTTREAMYSVAAHELVHAAARGDVAFVSDLLKARSKLIDVGLYNGPDIDKYRAAYADKIEGMSEAEAQKYLEEEMIGDFIRDLEKNSGEIIDYLAKNNRSLLQKIIDFFANLFNKDGTPNRAAQILAKDLRAALNASSALESAGVKVDTKIDKAVGNGSDSQRNSKDVDDNITKADIDILRSIPRKSVNEFSSEDIKKTEKWARKFYKELGVKSPFFRAWFGDWRSNDTSVIPVLETNKTEGKNPRGTFINDDTGWNISSSSVGYDETISHSGRDKVSVRVMRSIDEVIKHSVLLDSEVSEYGRGKKSSGTAFIHKFYTLVRVDGNPYIAKMAVDESHMPNQDTYKKFYHVRAIEISPASSVGTGLNQIAHLLNAGDTNISIANLFELVKSNDNSFKPKPTSKVVNKDGTPRVVYHWTNSDFTEFDPSRSGSNQGKTHGDGIYLSTSSDEFSYAGKNQMMLYAEIKNPFEMEMTEEEAERVYEKYAAPFHVDKFGLYKPHAMNALMSRYKVFDYLDEYASENKIKVSDILKELGYDGVHDGTEWVAYEPTQIKSATDNIGTFDKNNPDIRYSRDVSKFDADYMSAVERGDTETAQRMVDEAAKKAGYDIKAYHGTNANFFTFDKGRVGKGNDQYGAGFYFASDKVASEHYGNRVIDSVLNIKNPIRITATGDSGRNLIDADIRLTSEQAYEVVKRHPDMYDEEDSPLGDYFDSYWEDGAEDWMVESLAEQYRDVGYLDSDLFRSYPNELHEALRDVVGWDGIEVTFEKTGEKFYIAWFDNQMKSADSIVRDDNGDVIPLSERFNPKNTDIRFSRDIETEVEKTIRRQQERIEYLSKQLRSHTPFGWAKSVSPTARHNFAAEIASELPGISVDMVSGAVKGVWDVFEAAKKDASDTAESRVAKAAEKAREVAKELVENAVQTEVNPLYEQYNDLRVKLRTTPVKMNVSKAEFGGEADYRAWRSENKGLLRVSDSDSALPIDTYYQELSAQYPEFFPEDITDTADQLKRLGEVAVELKAIAGNKTEKVNPLEEVAESFTVDLANRILYGFDQLARVNPAAKHEYGALKNEQDVREAYASGTSDAAYREAEAYERGETAGKKRNEKEVQAALEREEIQRQIFERDFKKAQKNFNDGIERQNKRIYALERQIEQRSEKNRLTVARRSTLATLNRLNTMLMNPNRNKHVPQHLRAPVARLLASLGSTRLPNGKTVRASDMYAIDAAEYGRFEAESIRVADELKTVIDANKVSKDNAISNQFIDNLTRNIETLKQIYAELNPYSADDIVLPPNLADTRRIEYIKQVGKILNMVEHYIKDSNVVFLNHKAVSAREASERLINDLKMRKGKIDDSGESSRLKEYLAGVGYEFLSADLAFKMIGESGVEIAQEYRRAQTMQANREQEFVDYMLKATDGKYSTHDAGFTGKLYPVTSNPNGPKATKSQIMQLYLTWKRPAGRRHLRNGGAIFTNELGQESKANTVQITQEIYNNLVSNLTEQDKLVADTIGKFLSRQCAEWGNEASMRMYGYRKFEDPSYFPLDVSKNALPSKWDSLDDFYKLENAGMTKSLKSNASSPLRMTDVFDIADYHVRTMAAYSAFAPVSNDVEKMMNMPGVAEAMNSGLGKKGVQYFETLMKSIASNKVRSGELADAAAPIQFLMNAYKRQAVAYNISTALKQPLSIVRALNEIEGKYVKKVPLVMSKAEYSRIYDTMLENSGVAKMKMLGFSDTGFGKSMRALYDKDYVNNAGIVRGALDKNKVGRSVVKAYDKFTDAGMWAAGKMDEVTWVRIWRACELEVADKYVGLSKTEAIKKTADRFNQIIGRTQVVDTILDTAPIMKNKAMAILTPFMNEPVKALASIITAADAVKNGKPNAGKKLRKAVGLVLLNNLVLEPIISTLMTMWKDEEDDTENIADFCKKFLKVYAGVNVDEGFSFAEFMSSNVVGGLFSFPIIQIFYETFSDSMNNYSNEKIDTAALTNLIKAAKNLITNVPKSKEDRNKSNYKLIAEFIGAAAAVFGVPANTLRKQTAAMYRSVLNVTDSYELQWEYNKVLYNLENGTARTQKGFYDILAAAYKDGDIEAYRMMLEDLTDVISSTPSAIAVDDIKEAIEKRGGKIEVGSDLWNVTTQARFYLPTFNSNMKVENFLSATYKELEKNGISGDGILLDMPTAKYYSTIIQSGDKQGEKAAKPQKYDYTVEVKTVDRKEVECYEMSATGYEQYMADVGLLSYQVLREMCSSANLKRWTNLTAEQKEYAIQKVYDYSKKKYTKDFDTDFNISSGGSWMEVLYRRNAGQVDIADRILREARSYDPKK